MIEPSLLDRAHMDSIMNAIMAVGITGAIGIQPLVDLQAVVGTGHIVANSQLTDPLQPFTARESTLDEWRLLGSVGKRRNVTV